MRFAKLLIFCETSEFFVKKNIPQCRNQKNTPEFCPSSHLWQPYMAAVLGC